jgi:hypothetical protein
VAWRGVAQRGVAWRGVNRPTDRQTDRNSDWQTLTEPRRRGALQNQRVGAAQDAGGPQGPPAALRRATASTGRAPQWPHYHDVTRMTRIMVP